MRAIFLAALLAAVSTPAVSAVLLPGTGWQTDQINAADTDSQNSPWTFTLTRSGIFRLTDAYNVGDIYTVSGSFEVASTYFAGEALPPSDPVADAAWLSDSFSHILIPLGPGDYSITIQGDGAGGLPAGFFVQLSESAIPEPATWGMMIAGFGLVGFAMRRRAFGTTLQ